MKNKELEIIEQIDNYLSGRMTLEESGVFEGKIQEDAHLAQAVEAQKLADDIIKGSRLNDIKIMMDKDFHDGKVRTDKGGSSIPYMKSVILFMLVGGGLFLIYTFNKPASVPTLKIKNAKENSLKNGDKSSGKGIVETEPDTNGLRVEKIAPLEKSEITTFSKTEKLTTEPEDQAENEIYPEYVALVDQEKVDSSSLKQIPERFSEDKKVPIRDTVERFVLPSELNPTSEKPLNKTQQVPVNTKEITSIEKEETTEKESIFNFDISGKQNNTYSFKPEYGEVFYIPMEKGTEGKITISDRTGNIVYEAYISSSRTNTWDGSNSRGGISSPNMYIYLLEFSNGEKESGQIIIY